MATRLQVAVYNTLVIDVVVESLMEADRIWAKWSVKRYKKRLPMGGAIMSDASVRTWDVPVGDDILPIKHLTSQMNNGWRE
jgi:hypothetical protein